MVDGLSAGRWLHVSQSVAAPPDGSDAGAVIRWYRVHRGSDPTGSGRATEYNPVPALETGDRIAHPRDRRAAVHRGEAGHPTGAAGRRGCPAG